MSKKRFLCESACLQRACAAWIHYYTYLRNRTRILRAAPIASYQTVFYVQRRTISVLGHSCSYVSWRTREKTCISEGFSTRPTVCGSPMRWATNGIKTGKVFHTVARRHNPRWVMAFKTFVFNKNEQAQLDSGLPLGNT